MVAGMVVSHDQLMHLSLEWSVRRPRPIAEPSSPGTGADIVTPAHQEEQRAAAEPDDRLEDGAAGSENHLRLNHVLVHERDRVDGFGLGLWASPAKPLEPQLSDDVARYAVSACLRNSGWIG